MDLEDNIWWLICETPSEKLCYYLISPYLNRDDDNYYAKLVYKTSKPFKKGNIGKLKDEEKWYKTIHRFDNKQKITIEDSAIQIMSNSYGFENGNDYKNNLTKVPKTKIDKIIKPPLMKDIYQDECLRTLFNRISEFYSVHLNEIQLSGSGGLFHEPFNQLNDLDIIIPIDTIEQLNKISCKKVPNDSNSIKLKDKNWPLRWSKEFDLIICPFFVYRKLNIPIRKLNSTKSKIFGQVEITNISYGIFNLPIFECKGVINRIIINSTFVRGLLEVGMILEIKGVIYDIIDGDWVGETIAIVSNEIILGLKKNLYLK